MSKKDQTARTVLIYLQAFWQLLRFEYYLMRGDFAALYSEVRNYPNSYAASPTGVMRRICVVIDLACLWYPKHVLCLHRSAATACLLRKYGVPAEMVLGVQQLPFRAHAWVEVDGRCVNDRPYANELYLVLDRC